MNAEAEGGPGPDGLGAIPLFEGMSPSELSRVDSLGTRIEQRETLVDQGDPGTYCYVILDGSASVYANGEYVATNGPGSTIGEMALIDHRPRRATVVADTEMALLRFDTAHFRALLEEMPKASERIMGILGARLEQR